APVDPKPAPAYEWLSTVAFMGGVAEWPLGTWYDQEHEFRSTAHWKPILNGASGFAPRSYDELSGTLEKRPIPCELWRMLALRKRSLGLFHPEGVKGDAAPAYAEAIRDGLDHARLELVRSVPHGEQFDFFFHLSSSPPLPFATVSPEESARDRARLDAVLSPPFGYIDAPEEGATVGAGASIVGWALDDSGVARITVAVDAGAAAPALAGLPHPGTGEAYPKYPGVEGAGFVFSLPALPPGPHALTVTVIAKDGGRTVMKRNVVGK